MHIGLVGLGRMGGSMRERLRGAGLRVTGYDRDRTRSDVDSLPALVEALPAPRIVWVMLPSGAPTRLTVRELAGVLEEGDLVIEGGNSPYTDDLLLSRELASQGVGYLDCGVSGGVWGLANGYGLMVGGEREQVERAMPIFDALRPEGPREEGFVHAGGVGAGHYAKMVHNGIEYGLMQAYAEGFEIMHASDYPLDLAAISEMWMHGSVVRSWLLELMVRAFKANGQDRDNLKGWVADSGEG
ncbi:MAG: 6-phosphogluconate dehydrogenase, partial [Actinomycetota bacterium]|nr:6-phosphogluconate dehydrogenase [Actinomycetota bacterium]